MQHLEDMVPELSQILIQITTPTTSQMRQHSDLALSIQSNIQVQCIDLESPDKNSQMKELLKYMNIFRTKQILMAKNNHF